MHDERIPGRRYQVKCCVEEGWNAGIPRMRLVTSAIVLFFIANHSEFFCPDCYTMYFLPFTAVQVCGMFDSRSCRYYIKYVKLKRVAFTP